MASTNSQRIAKGEQLLKEGKKCLATGLFQWKPNHEAAVVKFEDAAKSFARGGDVAKQVEALRLASASHEKMNSYHLAAKALTTASMAMSRARENVLEAANLLAEAGNFHMLNSYPDKGIECYARSGELYCDEDSMEDALGMFNACFDAISDESRAKFSHDAFKKVCSQLLRKGRVDDSLHFYQRTATILNSADVQQPEALYKTLVCVIVLLLHQERYQEAVEEMDKCMSVGEFATSKYYEACQKLISALLNHSSEEYAAAAANRELTYLDNQVALLAKRLVLNEDKASAVAGPNTGANDASLENDEDWT